MSIETYHLHKLREEFLREVGDRPCLTTRTYLHFIVWLCANPLTWQMLGMQPDGLPLDHFVSVMLKYLPKPEDPVKAARDLCELFAQVDVNGDGTMEWGEFSAFCIEAGTSLCLPTCCVSNACPLAAETC